MFEFLFRKLDCAVGGQVGSLWLVHFDRGHLVNGIGGIAIMWRRGDSGADSHLPRNQSTANVTIDLSNMKEIVLVPKGEHGQVAAEVIG